MKTKIRLLTGTLCLLVVLLCALGLSACGTKECEHKWGAWSITTGATCTADGVRGRTCLECGKTEAEPVAATGHTPVTVGFGCAQESKCSACGEVLEAASGAHVGGTATCSALAVCTVCNTPYGELDINAHSGGTATCTEQATCVDCGNKYGELGAHGDTEWVNDKDSHYLTCSVCSAPMSEEEAHTKVDGICTVCGYAPTVEGAYAEAVIEDPTAEDIEVQLTISIENNPGILGLMLSFEYNTEIFTMISAENGSAFGTLNFTAPETLGSGATFIWDGLYLEDEDIADGDILTITFRVSASAPAGSYAVLLHADAFDNDLAPIVIGMESATIVIKNA